MSSQHAHSGCYWVSSDKSESSFPPQTCSGGIQHRKRFWISPRGHRKDDAIWFVTVSAIGFSDSTGVAFMGTLMDTQFRCVTGTHGWQQTLWLPTERLGSPEDTSPPFSEKKKSWDWNRCCVICKDYYFESKRRKQAATEFRNVSKVETQCSKHSLWAMSFTPTVLAALRTSCVLRISTKISHKHLSQWHLKQNSPTSFLPLLKCPPPP